MIDHCSHSYWMKVSAKYRLIHTRGRCIPTLGTSRPGAMPTRQPGHGALPASVRPSPAPLHPATALQEHPQAVWLQSAPQDPLIHILNQHKLYQPPVALPLRLRRTYLSLTLSTCCCPLKSVCGLFGVLPFLTQCPFLKNWLLQSFVLFSLLFPPLLPDSRSPPHSVKSVSWS